MTVDPISAEPLPPRCPVVYLPGIDGTGRLLHWQTALRDRYELHCVSYPQDCRHSYADLVSITVGHLEKAGPAVILAESFGGAVALMLGLEQPDRVRRLVLVNTFAYYPRRLFIDVAALVGPWLPMKPTHPATRRLRGLFFFGRGIPRADQDQWWDLTADVPMRVYGHRFSLLRDLDLRARLGEIKVPSVVFTSSNDWVVPSGAGRLLAKRLPRANRISIPAGHAAMIDRRVNVAEWLENANYWCDSNSSCPGNFVPRESG